MSNMLPILFQRTYQTQFVYHETCRAGTTAYVIAEIFLRFMQEYHRASYHAEVEIETAIDNIKFTEVYGTEWEAVVTVRFNIPVTDAQAEGEREQQF